MISSLITALFLMGLLTAQSASSFLYIIGALLILAEISTLSTFGILAFKGLIALAVAYMIDTGANTLFGLSVDWPFFFGIAFVELVAIAGCIWVFLHLCRKKVTTGAESLIGEQAEIIEWNGTHGRVRIHGEIWNAMSEKDIPTAKTKTPTAKLTITRIDKMTLWVEG